ncbi:MAG: hypothetical protein CMM96_01040 [Rickettsiales bacterium]|nr:hypothetical protein [Rickettsiales bacterium]
MKKLKVKICGVKTKHSIVASKNADFLGFVFYPKSPRFIKIEKAKYLVNYFQPNQKKVGLFVDSDINVIKYISEELKLDYIQLHGKENLDKISYLKNNINNIKIIKSIGIDLNVNLEKLRRYEAVCDMILFDTKYNENAMPGGNGFSFDWSILKNIKMKNEWMLAGGINEKNIKLALKKTKAPILDLSSSLEYKKGYKSPSKIKRFMKLIRAINNYA